MVQQTLDGAATTSRKRNSYSREEKLRVIKWYGENGKNLYQTCKHFALNSKTVIRWLQGAETIRKSRKRSKRVKFTRKGALTRNGREPLQRVQGVKVCASSSMVKPVSLFSLG